jgi:localization factor PodJL
MTSNVPWSVKGIDPKTREAAKDLARRSGMTLGEYINTVINQEAEGGQRAIYGDAASGPESSVALEQLGARIEAAEARSSAAIRGVDQSVQGVLARLAATEQGQAAVASRLEGFEKEMAGRLVLPEGDSGAPVAAFKSLESAIGKVAAQLYESDDRNGEALTKIVERLERAEAQTTVAVKRLETSFAGLDERLRATEARGPAGPGVPDSRFEQLATELHARVDAAREEMAQTLEQAAEGRFDRMERVVETLTGHVEAAERRSHQAIEKLGHEVLRVAETLGKRMVQVENRSADAVEQVGGEVVRIAAAMESRLRVSDNAHAEALERLGEEIARISERLAERIATSERRSAQAIDSVGDQVLRATDKLNTRYDRAASDLADRIRASEDRTARFLDEARERLGRPPRRDLPPAARLPRRRRPRPLRCARRARAPREPLRPPPPAARSAPACCASPRPGSPTPLAPFPPELVEPPVRPPIWPSWKPRSSPTPNPWPPTASGSTASPVLSVDPAPDADEALKALELDEPLAAVEVEPTIVDEAPESGRRRRPRCPSPSPPKPSACSKSSTAPISPPPRRRRPLSRSPSS